IDWTMLPDYSTRVLRVWSRDSLGDETDLELAVTGNGLLAHRSGSAGPTQIELGWGPDTELDYLSAAFSAVIVARLGLSPGDARRVQGVHIGTDDLELTVLDQEYRCLEAGRLLCLTPATCHKAELVVGDLGALMAYGDLLR